MIFDYEDNAARASWMAANMPLDGTATLQVAIWIENDGKHVEDAKAAAASGPDTLQGFLTGLLNNAPHGSAAWHTRQALSNNQLDNGVHWWTIGETLLQD